MTPPHVSPPHVTPPHVTPPHVTGGPSGPSEVLSSAISHAISDSSGEDEDDLCPSTPWSRSMLLRSLLMMLEEKHMIKV